MSRRRNISSGSRWEPLVGYSRAVRIGNLVCVSGTTATGAEGEIVGAGDAAVQMRQCLRNIGAALAEAGARLEDVIRARIYVTDITCWRAIGEAHREVFGTIRRATSMVEVARLIDPSMLVEVEADAVLDE
jgi:enamine deaminase RidA (YjgF/YER057c/UK114 family)